MRVLMEIDNTPARLPVRVADSAKEMAILSGASINSIRSTVSKWKHGIIENPRFIEVEVDE